MPDHVAVGSKGGVAITNFAETVEAAMHDIQCTIEG